MTAMIGILMFLSIWIPAIISGSIAFEPTADTQRAGWLRDRRFLVAGGAALLAALILLYAFGRGFGPIRVLLGAFRGGITAQNLADWCLALLFALPAAAVIGCAVRFHFSAKRRSRRTWEALPRRKKALLTLTAVCAAAVWIFGVYLGLTGTSGLRIQEICREVSILGSEGGEEDVAYIILKNTGDLPCETGGMQLITDTDDRPFTLASKTIAPGGTALFQTQKERFVDIKKSGGTTVRLVTPFGTETDAVTLPEMPDDMVWLLTDQGWTSRLSEKAAQAAGTAEIAAPTFSEPGGFYDNAFSLALSAPEGCEIYYTVDGSTPSAETTAYTGPIRVYDRSAEPNQYRSIRNVRTEYLSHSEIGTEPVDKAFVVRAVAVDRSGAQSAVRTETYFIGLDAYRDRTVVALTADPEDLFGENGIYVTGAKYEAWYQAKREAEAAGNTYSVSAPQPNFMQHGALWERGGNFEVFHNAQPVLNQPVGVRIQGNTSRSYALKRFSVFSRSQYSGSRLFAEPLFDGKQTHSITLRSGFDNAFTNALVSGRNVAVLGSAPATVFLDGEFWYDTFIQEKYSNTFFAETYGVAKDDVEYIRIGMWENSTASEKDTYTELLHQIGSMDLSDDDAYAALNEIIDVQSYIDYACINAYLANSDSNDKMNTCVWRTKTNEFLPYGDRRWRWALNDMDLKRDKAAEVHGCRMAELNTFSQGAHEDTERFPPLLSGSVFWETLKTSPRFRQQFALTFMDLVNTTFEPQHVAQLLEAWGSDLSYDDDFYRDRAGFITGYMAEELGLSGTQETLTITTDTPDGGAVRLNTVTPDLSGGSWSGAYYTDYPVTLTAEPAEGHTFVGWDVNGTRYTDLTIEVPIRRGGSTVHAIFQ